MQFEKEQVNSQNCSIEILARNASFQKTFDTYLIQNKRRFRAEFYKQHIKKNDIQPPDYSFLSDNV